MKNRADLKTFLHVLAVIGEDVDLYVDGLEGLAYCGTRLTPEGEEQFKEALTLCYVEDGYVIEWSNDDTDDEDGIPSCAYNAQDMLHAMAGLCSVDDYNKWFITK